MSQYIFLFVCIFILVHKDIYIYICMFLHERSVKVFKSLAGFCLLEKDEEKEIQLTMYFKYINISKYLSYPGTGTGTGGGGN